MCDFENKTECCTALSKLEVNHIGVAVKSIKDAYPVYSLLGFRDTDGREYCDELQGVRARFISKDGMTLELLEPLDPGKPSPLDNYLKGQLHSLYHICYRTDSLEATIEELRKNKFRLIVEPIPGIGFGDARVCFLFNRRVGIIELVEIAGYGK